MRIRPKTFLKRPFRLAACISRTTRCWSLKPYHPSPTFLNSFVLWSDEAMLTIPTSVRIFLATQPCDMRKGFDGLSALVSQMGEDVFSGHLFVFLSRNRQRAKIITWSEGGFVLFYKRLERGRFKLPRLDEKTDKLTLESAQLAMLLDGIDYSRVRRPRRWNPPGHRQKG